MATLSLHSFSVNLYARRERCWIKEALVMATLPLHFFSVNLYARRERCWIKEARVMATLPLHSFSVCKERERCWIKEALVMATLSLHSFSVNLYARRERCWIKAALVMATLPLHSFSVNLYARRESYNAHYCLCTSDARASPSTCFSYQDAHKFSTHTIPTQYLGLPLHVNSTHNQVKTNGSSSLWDVPEMSGISQW